MTYTPLHPYFIVKIDKKEQQEKREKLTQHIIANPATTFMQRELQAGEIVGIGESAHDYFPEAEIGDTLLLHHFITGKTDAKKGAFYMVDSDDEFNYYAVTAYEVNGERNMSYGVIKNGVLIPNPDYVFLEIEQIKSDVEGIDMPFAVSQTGLYVAKEVKKTREEMTEIMKKNTERIKQLSRNLPQSEFDIMVMDEQLVKDCTEEIKKLENENYKISKDINKKKYEPFKILAISPSWNEYIKEVFGEYIQPEDIGYFLNMACHTTIEIDGFEMIVAQTKYFGCPMNWATNAVNDTRHKLTA